MSERASGALAAAGGLATWGGALWIVGRFVAVPLGAFVFWGVALAVAVALTLTGRFPGFHGQSLALAIAVGAAAWVAMGPLDTPLRPLATGVGLIGLAGAPGVMAAGMILDVTGRAQRSGEEDAS